MTKWDTEDFVAVGIIILVITLFLGTGIYVTADKRAQRDCLARGWPRAQVDWALNKYCTARIDQTDVVRPLEKAEQR